MDKQQLQAQIESVEKRLRTNLESVEKKLIDLQNDIANFKAKLDEMHDEPEIPDFPEFKGGEIYWFCDNELKLHTSEHCNYTVEDFNEFHRETFAQEFSNKCKLIAMMLHCKWHLCRDFKEDFSKYDLKWYVYYANNTNHFAADYCVNDDHCSVYFDNEENAQKCADWLNKHWKEDDNE